MRDNVYAVTGTEICEYITVESDPNFSPMFLRDPLNVRGCSPIELALALVQYAEAGSLQIVNTVIAHRLLNALLDAVRADERTRGLARAAIVSPEMDARFLYGLLTKHVAPYLVLMPRVGVFGRNTDVTEPEEPAIREFITSVRDAREANQELTTVDALVRELTPPADDRSAN
jgi:hypothetical protein